MPNNIKELIINKLFRYKNDTESVIIDKVLYFSSKIWYIGSIIEDNITKPFMAYFGHYQPNAKSIITEDNIVDIIFIDLNKDILPSTVVPIEDVIEIMYNSTINDLESNSDIVDVDELRSRKAAHIKNDEIDKIERTMNGVSSENNSRATLLNLSTDKLTFPNSHNYGMLGALYRNALMAYFEFGTSPFFDSLQTFMFSKDYKNREEITSGKYQGYNHYESSYDDTVSKEQNVYIIGHAIRIGYIKNDKEKFIGRYGSVIGKDIKITNLHHNCLEMDNEWKYYNSMLMQEGEESLDLPFCKLASLDFNIQPFLSETDKMEKTKITISLSSNLESFINDDKENLLKEDDDGYDTLFNNYKTIINLIESESDDYDKWMRDGQIKKESNSYDD